jgi:hypothetical protein
MEPSAQEADKDSLSASDASLTQQQWRQRVENARPRSAEFVAKTKAGMPEIESKEEEKLADQRAIPF